MSAYSWSLASIIKIMGTATARLIPANRSPRRKFMAAMLLEAQPRRKPEKGPSRPLLALNPTDTRLWQTESTMLIELWERLRGYGKWTPAVATVQSTTSSPVGEIGSDKSQRPVALGSDSICKIRWLDLNQKEHTAEFQAFEESPLYQLFEGTQ